MFQDVLAAAQGPLLAGNDLGRVVIHHDGLQDAIVVPLQPWDNLNADVVMSTIEKVLNSHQELAVNHSLEITVGCIELPKGAGRRRITRIHGNNNSLDQKKSIVTIQNEDDPLCMARAIGVCWAKLHRCTEEEWREIVQDRGGRSNLELALLHRKVSLPYYNDLINKCRKGQKALAVAISRLAGVPVDRPASVNDIPAFEEALGMRILVVSARLGNKFITGAKTDRPERPCAYLYLVDDDHFHAITTITGFFSSNYFCDQCLKHYNNREDHRCEVTCIVCKSDDCPETDTPMSCRDCHMTCRSKDCFLRHKIVPKHVKGKNKGEIRDLSPCQKWYKCSSCFKVINASQRDIEDHVCGEHFCGSCKQYVMEDHLCYLRSTPHKEKNIPKFIFFDFETTQDELLQCDEGYHPHKIPGCEECRDGVPCKRCTRCQHCTHSWCGKNQHRPNFVVAHTVCPKCIDTPLEPDSICKGCGSRCESCMEDVDTCEEGVDPCPGTCGRRETVFRGDHVTEEFGRWLFDEQHAYFKAIAHNMKGFDGYFLLEYLIDQSIRPDRIIYNGSKIMYMQVEKDLHITVLDSLNFLPMKLSALPKAFGLSELKKGFFPHYWNTRSHQRATENTSYPEPKYYGVDYMGCKEREEFFTWYDTVKDDPFDFNKEILEYCRSDVDILRQACLEFRTLMMSSTGQLQEELDDQGNLVQTLVKAIDPFDYVTIASVCMGVYRTKFLEETLEVKLGVDDDEWCPGKRIDGEISVWQDGQWLKEEDLDKLITENKFVSTTIAQIPPCGYREQYSKVSIQWLEWVAKEKNIRIQHALNMGEKKIPGSRYKLDGYCEATNTAFEFHGCVFHGCPTCFPHDRESTIHPLTKQSMSELYALTLKKESYIKSLGMKYACIWEHDFQQRCKADPNMQRFIQTLEVTDRLNPRDSFFGGRTNASKLHYKVDDDEKIHYVDFTSLYPWVNKYARYPVGHPRIITSDFEDFGQYFGIAQVKMLPPRGLYHPVLPYRSNGKLKFPLCRTCADNENQSPCTCSDEERALMGTWCTPEIQMAIDRGYEILQIYEVYHWDETTKYDPTTREGGLFSEYINTFLKIKQEASGHPEWIKTTRDTFEYVQKYFEKEGVQLDSDSIEKNSGLRALAKLCLNSFWGKFGQQLNHSQTEFVHESEPDRFFQLLSDPTKEVKNFHIVTDDTILLEWLYKKDCMPADNKTNVYLATFTTCWARLKLYGILDTLKERVLYYDTDSVIYVSRPGEYDPPLGDYLGDLTNELDKDDYIEEFVSGGPKNYAYRTNSGKETCKVRGFTLNFTNSRIINFQAIKDIVTATQPKILTVVNPRKICRDKRKRKLYNREEEKAYRMVYTKRARLDNFDTVPYGY